MSTIMSVESPAVRAAWVLGATLLVAPACSGDTAGDTGDATDVTVAAVDVEPLFGSLSGFVAAFVAVGEAGITAGAEPFPLTASELTTGPLPTGGEGFVTADAIPNGVLGGTVDADGAVTAVFVFLDPVAASAAPAVISLLGTTIATPATFDQAAFAAEYRQLALEAPSSAGEQRWTPSSNGSGHSLVTTVVEGASGSGNLIEVAIVPVADEVAAKAAVKPIRNAVIGLLAG